MTTTVNHLLDRKGRDILSIGPDDPVLEAVRAMADRHVGALLVMEGGHLRGIVSERDYARKVVLQGRSSADTPVRDIMTKDVIAASPETTLHMAMRIMTEHRIRHLPVMRGDRLEGILSIGDLVKAVIEEQQVEIDQLHSYIHG